MDCENFAYSSSILPITRRKFVQGCAAGAALSLVDGLPVAGEIRTTPLSELSGTHFDLSVDEMPVNFTGRRATATAVNGAVPGPLLRWREGDTVTISVTNHLKVPTSIHWHSLRIPADMDGVPGLSFRGIAPGKTFIYRFPVQQHGTAWYHSHTRFQEQSGLIGALIIEPRSKDPLESERDYVVFLSDWTDTDPETVFRNLKEQSDYYNFHRYTVPNFVSAAAKEGFWKTISRRLAWAKMNMSPGDILDVTGATYTYLLNGNPPDANWTGIFKPGERVRLRFINGSSMTAFDVRIPGLKLSVVQADGNDLQPVTVDEFRINVAETYDVIVQPQEERAYTIFAESMDRSGFARGTLAPRQGMMAPIPALDPVPTRPMSDMGMGSMKGMKGMQMGSNMVGMDGMTQEDMSSGSMAGMPMESGGMMNLPMSSAEGENTHQKEEPPGKTGSIPYPQPGPDTKPFANTPEPEVKSVEAHLEPTNPVHLHVGPEVDNVAMEVTERLNDPGVGLHQAGRKVLTYADLRARYEGTDGRPPTREVVLHLTGNMTRFIWGFDGEKFSEAEPIVLRLGERIRFVLINDTMMEHPIHLHGLWSELENGNGRFNPYKHTVSVKPAERVSYLVSADTPGSWAFHCHLLYHMEAGMFRTVEVIP